MNRWLLLAVLLAGLIALTTSSGGARTTGAAFEVCPPVNISVTPGKSTHPRIAVDRSSGAIFVVWEEEESPENHEIMLARLSFNPACFSPPEDEAAPTLTPDNKPLQVKNVSNNVGDSRAPDLALGGGQGGFVVWQDNTMDEDDNPRGLEAILLRRFTFTTGGEEGILLEDTDTLNISGRPNAASAAPSIVVDGLSRSFVAWQQASGGEAAEIFFTSDRPYSPKVRVFRSPTESWAPRLAVTPLTSKVFVVWQEKLAPDQGNWEIFVSSSSNAEQRFVRPDFDDPPANISNTLRNSQEPVIAALSQTEQLVVWSDDTPGDYDILLRRSTEGFKPHLNVSDNCSGGSVGDSRQPAISVADLDGDDSDEILIAWQEDVLLKDGRHNKDIFFVVSEFHGETFECLNVSAELRIPVVGKEEPQPSPYGSGLPALATDKAGNIFIVWEEQVSPYKDDTEIYFIALKRR